MNRIHLKLIAALIIAGFLVGFVQAHAAGTDGEEPLSIGFYFGPALPNDNLNNVYNVVDTSGLQGAYEYASSLGYHLGGMVRFGISNSFSFSGAIQLTQFPGQTMKLADTLGRQFNVETVTNILPIYAGLAFVPFKTVVKPILSAELLYSYSWTSVNTGQSILQDVLSPGTELEPKQSRLGAAFGAGIEVDVAGFRPFLNVKYTLSNLVGRDEQELVKSFINISLGLML